MKCLGAKRLIRTGENFQKFLNFPEI